MDPETGEVDSNKIWYEGSLFTIEGKGWTNTENFYERLPLSAPMSDVGLLLQLGPPMFRGVADDQLPIGQ